MNSDNYPFEKIELNIRIQKDLFNKNANSFIELSGSNLGLEINPKYGIFFIIQHNELMPKTKYQLYKNDIEFILGKKVNFTETEKYNLYNIVNKLTEEQIKFIKRIIPYYEWK